MMDIYVKPVKKVSVIGRDLIVIQDIAEVVAVKETAETINKLMLKDMKKELSAREKKTGKTQVLISITEVIRLIKQIYPDCNVVNVGEINTIIDYQAQCKTENKYWKWLKISLVSLILLTGSSTAIMSFHADAEIPKIFKNYYKIFFGEETEKPYIIDIPYSIGLGLGIIVFFNHFAGLKITHDPTPIEVEMSLYDNEITDTVIDTLSSENKGTGG